MNLLKIWRSFYATKCKIVVLKKNLDSELAREYCKNEVTSCPAFTEGQEFIAGFEKPEGFCDWAWNDIYRFVAVLLSGGNFSKDIFEGWMKDDKTMKHVVLMQYDL